MRGLVLDVDDTVYLEQTYVASGFAAVEAWCANSLGVLGVGARAWRLFEDGGRGTTLTDALRDLGVEVTPEVRRAVVDAYRAHIPDIELLPDARALIELARSLAIPVGVVTDGPVSSQRAKVAALGLGALAKVVVVTAEWGTSKPDPAVFLAVEKGLSLAGHELVYVADNPIKDFQGPQALGWKSVRVRREGALHYQLATPPGVTEVPRLDSHGLVGLLSRSAAEAREAETK
ncbi:HAD family hydrolase [Nocardioides piscis]|uniref:HAD family hydrolase n=1 Tax=Nocardioides piscis TaxID=2714938 RepID=A0A6G7YEK2_9ACTN|nr:HAD family hydrolase [Nocardioides piscis]QIK75235.1 HAD family hydrolase [Nocardioides piscis]